MKRLITVSTALSALLLLFTSCGNGNDGNKIARVFDNYLYESDIQGIVPPGSTPEDSAAIVANYIQQWIQEMVILEKAKRKMATATNMGPIEPTSDCKAVWVKAIPLSSGTL